MESVYLGLFSSLFKAIFDAILKPVIEFIGGIINTVFTWVFENILKPLLIDVLLPLFKWLAQLIFEILASLFYSVLAELLKVIDTIQKIFNVFAGIDPITYEGKGYNIVEFFFSRAQVQRAAWAVIAISLALMFAFSIAAVMRSMADLSGEMKNPVSKVLRLTFECFLKLLMIPLVCMLLILLSGRILQSVNSAILVGQQGLTGERDMSQNSETTLGRVIFCMSTLDAAQDGKTQFNVNGGTGTPKDTKLDPGVSHKPGIMDELRAPYYYTNYSKGSRNYYDTGSVKQDFKYEKINYIVGFGVGLIFLKVLLTCIFKFINRMFNVLLLYISSPLFVCSMPLDEGKNYNQWKDMFVGQLFSGYGSVVAMQLYLIIAPSILNGDLEFISTTSEGDMVIRMVFIIGGAFAVENAGTVITGLISSTAASMESAQEKEASGLIDQGKALGKLGLGIAKKLVGKVLPGGGKKPGDAGAGGGGGGAAGAGGAEGGGDGKGGEGAGGGEGGKGADSNKFDGKGGSTEAGKGAKFDGKKPNEGAGEKATKQSAQNLANKKAAGGAAKPGAGGPGAGKADTNKNDAAGAGKGGAGKAGAGKGAAKPGVAGKPDTKGEAEEEEQEEEEAANTGADGKKSGGKKGTGAAKKNAADASKSGAAGGGKKGKKNKNEATDHKHKVTSKWFGGLLVLGRDKDGKRRFGLNLGSKLHFGLKEDGTVSCNVFGIASWGKGADGQTERSILGGAFKWGQNADGTKNRSLLGMASWNTDKEGNTTKVKVPFFRFKSVSDGKGGSTMKLSKVKLAKGLQFRRAFYTDKDGKVSTEMYCSDFSALSFMGMEVKKRFDEETGKIETLSNMSGDHFAKTKNEKGEIEYVKTHSNFLRRTKIYDRDKAGKYHVVATKGWLTSESYKLNKETGENVLVSSKLNAGGLSLYDDLDPQFDDSKPKLLTPQEQVEENKRQEQIKAREEKYDAIYKKSSQERSRFDINSKANKAHSGKSIEMQDMTVKAPAMQEMQDMTVKEPVMQEMQEMKDITAPGNNGSADADANANAGTNDNASSNPVLNASMSKMMQGIAFDGSMTQQQIQAKMVQNYNSLSKDEKAAYDKQVADYAKSGAGMQQGPQATVNTAATEPQAKVDNGPQIDQGPKMTYNAPQQPEGPVVADPQAAMAGVSANAGTGANAASDPVLNASMSKMMQGIAFDGSMTQQQIQTQMVQNYNSLSKDEKAAYDKQVADYAKSGAGMQQGSQAMVNTAATEPQAKVDNGPQIDQGPKMTYNAPQQPEGPSVTEPQVASNPTIEQPQAKVDNGPQIDQGPKMTYNAPQQPEGPVVADPQAAMAGVSANAGTGANAASDPVLNASMSKMMQGIAFDGSMTQQQIQTQMVQNYNSLSKDERAAYDKQVADYAQSGAGMQQGSQATVNTAATEPQAKVDNGPQIDQGPQMTYNAPQQPEGPSVTEPQVASNPTIEQPQAKVDNGPQIDQGPQMTYNAPQQAVNSTVTEPQVAANPTIEQPQATVTEPQVAANPTIEQPQATAGSGIQIDQGPQMTYSAPQQAVNPTVTEPQVAANPTIEQPQATVTEPQVVSNPTIEQPQATNGLEGTTRVEAGTDPLSKIAGGEDPFGGSSGGSTGGKRGRKGKKK